MAFVIGNANKMLLLFDRRCVEIEVGKNITRHNLPKGLTMLFIFACHSNLSKRTTKKND